MQTHFHYHQNELYVEQVKASNIVEQVGTPCYVYSRAALMQQWDAFQTAFGTVKHRICYAVKANSNLAILNLFAKQLAGFDIVSQGELERVLVAQGDPKNIIFSGVGKQVKEIQRAIEVGIGCFNIESAAELTRLQEMAKQADVVVNVALRINPDINAKTHPYIATGLMNNKFGVPFNEAILLCRQIQSLSHINLVGLACHIGSQITELQPFLDAIDRILKLIADLRAERIGLKYINVGGGLGISYQHETPPSIKNYVEAICKKLSTQRLEIIIEPGRILVAHAGTLLSRVEYIKSTPQKNFLIMDVGMNDLMRPALYHAWHEIVPVIRRSTQSIEYDVVGPVCESADCLGKGRLLNAIAGDLLAIMNTGAYGASMSSNYNSRPRPAEVLIDKDKIYLIKQREKIQALFANESMVS